MIKLIQTHTLYALYLTCLMNVYNACAEEISTKVSDISSSQLLTDQTLKYETLSHKRLDADGKDKGLPAYQLIKNFGGKRSIESPDLYSINHPDVPHITEDYDNEVGEHFVFKLHRDIDIDRDRTDKSDRQRNEIKAYGGSEKALKGYSGETLEYRWKFKLNENFAASKRFGHIFQLKSVDNTGIGMPILTISTRNKNNTQLFSVRHAPIARSSLLYKAPLSEITGQWVEVVARVKYGNHGKLYMQIKRLHDQKVLIEVNESNIDMWRGETNKTDLTHFVRPKWGLYRSILSKEQLNPGEEQVSFANFEVIKLKKL